MRELPRTAPQRPMLEFAVRHEFATLGPGPVRFFLDHKGTYYEVVVREIGKARRIETPSDRAARARDTDP
jgi:hypothetical protein